MKKSLILLAAVLLFLPTAALAKGGHGDHGGHGSHGGHGGHGGHGSRGSHSSKGGHSSKSSSKSSSFRSRFFGGSHSSSSTHRASSSGSPVSSWKSLDSQKSYASSNSDVPDLYRSGSLTNRMLYGSYFRQHYHASNVQQSEEEKNEDSLLGSKLSRHPGFLIAVAIFAVLLLSMIVASYLAYR